VLLCCQEGYAVVRRACVVVLSGGLCCCQQKRAWDLVAVVFYGKACVVALETEDKCFWNREIRACVVVSNKE
jgi:hypothetical protein